MKLLILTFAMISFNGSAEDRILTQLTTPEYREQAAQTFANNDFTSSSYVKVSQAQCERLSAEREKLRDLKFGTREFEAVMIEVRKLSELCGVEVSTNESGDVVGFSFTNDTQNRINPRTAEHGSEREFRFEFEERSIQNVNLQITENSGIDGKISHDLLETTIIFLPRKVIPYIEMNEEIGECKRKIILPTNEYIILDAITKEIISGVLREAPMDMNESRHRRKFAGIEYTGNGIMIRADRRSGTPEHIYSTAFNINEKTDKATITHKGKTCYVSKRLIWENADNADLGAYFKYSTDQEFLDQVINPHCGWGLSLGDIM